MDEVEGKLSAVQLVCQKTQMKLQMVEQVLAALRDEERNRGEAFRLMGMKLAQAKAKDQGEEETVAHEQARLSQNRAQHIVRVRT